MVCRLTTTDLTALDKNYFPFRLIEVLVEARLLPLLLPLPLHLLLPRRRWKKRARCLLLGGHLLVSGESRATKQFIYTHSRSRVSKGRSTRKRS